MMGSGTNFVATVIGFAMSVTFIIFICTRIICWRLRGGDSRPMFEIESRIDIEQELHRMNGLEPVVVAAIPTMKFTPEAFSSAEEAHLIMVVVVAVVHFGSPFFSSCLGRGLLYRCSICLGEYQEKEVLRIMPKCGHNFHLSCIDVWLRKQSTCPVCRFPVQQDDSFEPKQDASFTSNLSMDLSEEHSRQWLLPVADPSLTNNVSSSSSSSSRGNSIAVPGGNRELTGVESHTRQQT
ncbi:unnamed protein product [Linum tenue]|uniref:RING-type domain-containing protein n=1 Tax=Linum tenue TaxID=586396 RepID=A0AAV0PK35_9ROSI|nr:unnamed protein product [Linum tenue]